VNAELVMHVTAVATANAVRLHVRQCVSLYTCAHLEIFQHKWSASTYGFCVYVVFTCTISDDALLVMLANGEWRVVM
jgi:hypothetical protein